jgi:predicted DNA-binding transcriptional regulator YafY
MVGLECFKELVDRHTAARERHWFLAGYWLLSQNFRLFRADRIATVQVIAETFKLHGEFDVRGFTQERLQNLLAHWQTEIWLETTPETIWREFVPPRAELKVEDSLAVRRERSRTVCGEVARVKSPARGRNREPRFTKKIGMHLRAGNSAVTAVIEDSELRGSHGGFPDALG